MDVSQSRTSELNSELAIVESAELHGQVLEEIGADQILGIDAEDVSDAGRAKALAKLQSGLSTAVLPESNVITLTYTHPDPEVARRILTRLVEGYMENHIKIHQTAGSYQFFRQQADDLSQELATKEAELEQLRRACDITDLAEERGRLLSRMDEQVRRRTEIQIALATETERIRVLEERRQSHPHSGPRPSDLIDRLREQLQELHIQHLDLAARYAPTSRKVRDIQAQITDVDELIRQEIDLQWQSAIQESQDLQPTLQAERVALDQGMQTIESRLADLMAQESRITQLKRDIDLADVQYRRYAESLEQARIDSALETEQISNLRTVQPPTLPLDPLGLPGWFLEILGLLVAGVGRGIRGGVSRADGRLA